MKELLRYKLEVYQKNFPNFVYGSRTNTQALNKDEKAKARLGEIGQEEEVQIEKPQNLKGKIIQEEEVQIEKPQDLKGRSQEKKEPHITQEQEQVESIPTIKEKISKIQPLNIEPQIELLENQVKTTKPQVGTKPLVEQIEATKIVVEEINVQNIT